MNVLTRICDDKKAHVKTMEAQTPLAGLERKIKNCEPPRGFIARLSSFMAEDKVPLITEVKKASPSKGVIRADFNPVDIAKIYEDNGAACLSVLTDEPYFQGKDEYFVSIRESVTLPMLRKDFMIDPYQIFESRALGADCILLIMAAIDDSLYKELYDLSSQLEMDVLVEVHDDEELERALDINPKMVGVNNRNLKTLDVDLQTGIALAQNMPNGILKIGESGIHSHADLMRLKDAGFHGFLIGESLMKQDDIGAAVQKILTNT